ncbi:MAG: DUF2304 domain-containing protein [Elusimicrobiota bacterium]
MIAYEPTFRTMVLVASVSLGYLSFLVYRVLQGRIDFYDLLMLSTACLLPALFVFWPGFAQALGALAGVAFPFIVMFGSLILVIFIFLHRITVKMHEAERLHRLLVQEVALLRHEKDSGDERPEPRA